MHYHIEIVTTYLHPEDHPDLWAWVDSCGDIVLEVECYLTPDEPMTLEYPGCAAEAEACDLTLVVDGFRMPAPWWVWDLLNTEDIEREALVQGEDTKQMAAEYAAEARYDR